MLHITIDIILPLASRFIFDMSLDPMSGGFFHPCEDFRRMSDHSFPTCTFCFKVEISSCILIPLFGPESVHSSSVSWDDCGWVLPDKLHVSLFLWYFSLVSPLVYHFTFGMSSYLCCVILLLTWNVAWVLLYLQCAILSLIFGQPLCLTVTLLTLRLYSSTFCVTYLWWTNLS